MKRPASLVAAIVFRLVARQPRHTALAQCRGLRRPRRFGNVALARTRGRLILVEGKAG